MTERRASMQDGPTEPLEAARSLVAAARITDAHCDVHLDLIRRRARGEARVLERRHLPGWVSGGVDLVVLNTVPKFGPAAYPYLTTPVHNYLYMLDCLHLELQESAEHLQLVTSLQDVERARADGKVGIIIGCEGAEPLGDDLSLLRCYHRLGLRVLTLTWHHRNALADGVAEPSGSGLSNLGREVVDEANRLGIVLDVSHASARAIEDVLERSSQPILASHSNARAVCDHQRNLHDGQIRAIAERGGVIGVVFLGRFVAAEDPDVHDVADHVEHIVGLVGYEHLALGPDYTTGGEDLVIDARRVAGPGQPVDAASIPYAAGLETYDGIPSLLAELISRGHHVADLRGMLGDNLLPVFAQMRADPTPSLAMR